MANKEKYKYIILGFVICMVLLFALRLIFTTHGSGLSSKAWQAPVDEPGTTSTEVSNPDSTASFWYYVFGVTRYKTTVRCVNPEPGTVGC